MTTINKPNSHLGWERVQTPTEIIFRATKNQQTWQKTKPLAYSGTWVALAVQGLIFIISLLIAVNIASFYFAVFVVIAFNLGLGLTNFLVWKPYFDNYFFELVIDKKEISFFSNNNQWNWTCQVADIKEVLFLFVICMIYAKDERVFLFDKNFCKTYEVEPILLDLQDYCGIVVKSSLGQFNEKITHSETSNSINNDEE